MAHAYIYGFHAIKTALQNNPERIVCLYVVGPEIAPRLKPLIKAANSVCRIEYCSLEALVAKLPSDAKHQGICAQVKPQKADITWQLLLDQHGDKARFALLEGVQDPHNLGACLRTAAAMGVHMVFLTGHDTVGLTPVVCKVACGAVDRIPIVTVSNVARLVRQMQERGVWVYGTSEHADTVLGQTTLAGPMLLAFGHEGRGLRALTQDLCDQVLRLPTDPAFPSLNLSVAFGMMLLVTSR